MISSKNRPLFTLAPQSYPHIPCASHCCPRILQIGNLSFYTTEEQIHDMFSKCANPEDGGGVKRIIMGLDRNTRYATLSYPPVLPDMDSSPPLFQDTMRVLLCRVLYARRSTREHAIHIGHQTGRANNPLRLGSWIPGRQAVWTRQKWRPGMLS